MAVKVDKYRRHAALRALCHLGDEEVKTKDDIAKPLDDLCRQLQAGVRL